METAIERGDDAAAFAGAPVFGGQDELDTERAEEVEVEQLGAAARAVEKRGPDLFCRQRFGERGERREPHAAGDHPRVGRRIDDREGAAERTEARDRLSRARVV